MEVSILAALDALMLEVFVGEHFGNEKLLT
jgi:hypothetical protein